MAPQYKPTLDEVRSLVGQGNIIAIHRELPADLETPVSVYLKLQSGGQSPSFLLESVEKGEQVGRYSFIGVNHPLTVSAVGDHVIVGAAGGAVLEEERGDPLQIVKELMAGRKSVRLPGLPLFNGGVVGYFSFSGDADLAIAIRTATIVGDAATVQAGAGIVAQSVAATEQQEAVSKAAAPLRAIAIANTLRRAE